MSNPVARRQLQEIISVMARELAMLVNEGRKIENAVGDTLNRIDDGILDSGIIESLQGLDYLVQAMDEISLILQELANEVDADILVDFDNTVSRFKLRALFLAFAGVEAPDREPERRRHAGGVELF